MCECVCVHKKERRERERENLCACVCCNSCFHSIRSLERSTITVTVVTQYYILYLAVSFSVLFTLLDGGCTLFCPQRFDSFFKVT